MALSPCRRNKRARTELALCETPAFESTDLDMVKCRHEVGSDLSRLSLVTALGEFCSPGLENVFQRAAIRGRATIPEKLHGERWGR